MNSVPLSPMEEAIQFLTENPTETRATAARIFNVNVKSLVYRLDHAINTKRGDVMNAKHGGQNKVMNDQEEKALENFIRSLLIHGIPPKHEAVFAAIQSLKRARDSTSTGPTGRWFRGWWKRSNLHKIKTKPLPVVRLKLHKNQT